MNEKAMTDIINAQNIEIAKLKTILKRHDKAIDEIVKFFNGLVESANEAKKDERPESEAKS